MRLLWWRTWCRRKAQLCSMRLLSHLAERTANCEDISAGDMILPSFSVLTPAAIGALLEAGVLSVEVITQPMVGIIPTGNEIVPPTENPREGDIIESNSAIFSGMLQEWGCTVRVYPPVPDSAELIEEALRQRPAECDAVVLNAGYFCRTPRYSWMLSARWARWCCMG